jgi:hypothetical protein
VSLEQEIAELKKGQFHLSIWSGEIEGRVKELEDVVALQNTLILELNKAIESGSAASEGIPRPEGEDSRAAVIEG